MMSIQGYQQAPGVSATVRPLTEPERQAYWGMLRPLKLNAIGFALVSMLMAVMINFVPDQWLIIVPIFFGVAALGMAVQARKTANKVVSAIAKGSVTDVRVSQVRKGAGGSWNFGPFSVPRTSMLNSMLSEGAPASVTIVPETRHLLSVNSVALKKPVTLIAPPGFESSLMVVSAPSVPQATRESANEDLPPPPEDWGAKYCPKCGASLMAGASFCGRCGSKLNQ